MRRRTPALIIACLFAVAGCGSRPTTPSTASVSVLTATSSSGFTAETTMTVTDQASWQAAWKTINGNVSPLPALPAIDFTQEVIVIAAMGSLPTGGYSAAFGAATEDGGVLTVDVAMNAPGSRCLTTQGFTSPVTVARIARRAGRNAPDVRVRITRRIKDC